MKIYFMEKDKRDVIWEKIFEVYYDSYWVEILSEKLINIWQKVDDVNKVLVAITASGSVISGWALWENPALKYIWITLAGFAALLSIIHAALSVANRIKDWTEIKRQFALLRIDLEMERAKMEINCVFNEKEFEAIYIKNKKKYAELYTNIRNDLFNTHRLKVNAQNELNKRISDILNTKN
jgi:hypothetical protein